MTPIDTSAVRAAVAGIWPRLHPLVRTEIERDVRLRTEAVRKRNGTEIKWSKDCLQMNINVVLFRLRAERFGKAIPREHDERRRQIAEAAAAAGIALDGTVVAKVDEGKAA